MAGFSSCAKIVFEEERIDEVYFLVAEIHATG
jgi:hypothetical protein